MEGKGRRKFSENRVRHATKALHRQVNERKGEQEV
jgi:hypothetical protein